MIQALFVALDAYGRLAGGYYGMVVGYFRIVENLL